ncbi:aminoglycoside phosphotransferase [Paenibacillus sp. LC231]|uniref:phosphotransferase n=1 Tax=Paenibacillus sp. LC231 TaxID=1120679 RepID=UPI0008DE6C27|nr:phosphotransferase [Paenibacillus sp. LC231]OIB00453.1 aminoglycoside phosphotransferase [Paenibacillus sp. LC231]
MDPRQIEILCNELGLGDIAVAPIALSGGLLHRMYAVQTTSGRYVVKALNPEIMARPTAMQNFIRSELIANRAANYVPALPAKKFNGASIQQVGEQFCLVYEWMDGKSLKPSDINTGHCKIMGSILSSLHIGDFSDLGIVNNSSEDRRLTDWNFYLKKGQESNAEWTSILFKNSEMLNDWNAEAINSAKQISTDMVISHGDLDPKNVLWDVKPILIDWECAGYRNSKQDLVETAIYWSENDSGEIDKDKFLSFIDGYKGITQNQIHANWRMILASGFLGKLDWLEYCLKRSLWIDCTDHDEQKAGTEQVAGTILAIKRYAEKINEIEGWLKEI